MPLGTQPARKACERMKRLPVMLIGDENTNPLLGDGALPLVVK